MRYAIVLRPSSGPGSTTLEKPKMIGMIGTPREQEVSYCLHQDYWGKGYMSEAIGMFLNLFWDSEGSFIHTVI
jgi:RimJ/RimL family protein N-acetyltransferase